MAEAPKASPRKAAAESEAAAFYNQVAEEVAMHPQQFWNMNQPYPMTLGTAGGLNYHISQASSPSISYTAASFTNSLKGK